MQRSELAMSLLTEARRYDKLGRGCVWHNEIPDVFIRTMSIAVRCRQQMLAPEFLVCLMASQHGRSYFQLTAQADHEPCIHQQQYSASISDPAATAFGTACDS